MELIEQIKKRAAEKHCTLVLPESYDVRVAQAAVEIAKQHLAKVVLLSDGTNPLPGQDRIEAAGIRILDYRHDGKYEDYVRRLYDLRKGKGLSTVQAAKLLENPLYYGAMLVEDGCVDGMVAGACHSTGDTLRPALQIVKTAPGIKTVSAYFLMVVPDCTYGSGGVFLFADSGLVEYPTEEQLADIAVASARSFEQMTGEEPVVALLSYSTKGSAGNLRLAPVIAAIDRVKKRYPNLKIDGELQLDAAIDESVAEMKCRGSRVAGKANVLIFPDLNSGNIGYKLVQRLAKAEAYGPVTQGLKRPVNDLSRGCSVQDIVGVAAITCLQADVPI
ncbi:phosphate acetyltransferase [Dorea sp. D27]|uniref:phosphate acetyltransferase n=1 Tax=Dorea sp. D27 TaxID=658665 RepID=UPI000673C488|nr:phosphate acetyltransferase [Dorea sp. D27]KMZ53626.1 phosphate acetyltransferase [Dorea sp. D27]